MPKLTKRFLDALRPKEKHIYVWDPDLSGFGCRVYPSGAKVFIAQYRNRAFVSRRVTIGPYGRFTVEQARTEGRRILHAASIGQDPAAEREAARETVRFREVAERFLAEHADTKKKARSAKEDRRLLEKIILPALGKMPVDAITRKEVARLHHTMSGTPTQANRTLAVLSKVFNLCESWGLRPDGSNACRHVQRYKENKRERYLSDEEFARLGDVLRAAEQNKTEWPAMLSAIRLLIFTGCRLGEILSLRWDAVDLETGTLLLRDSKTGPKRVMLGAAAVEVLQGAFRMDRNENVCPGLRPGRPIVGLQRAWERLRTAAGLEDVRLHDLRHSFASVGASAGMSLPTLGALLGHTQPGTTSRYSHLSPDPLRRAVEEIDAKIDAAMRARPKVVSLKG